MLEPHQDPASMVPMRQTEGTALCYVNSIINALKTKKEYLPYLSQLFTPKGCTLHVTGKNPKTGATVQKATNYSYSKCKKLPSLGMQGEETFSMLERTMLHHARTKQGNVWGGGSPIEGAQMLGLRTMSKVDSWPYDVVKKQSGVISKIKEHLNAGRIVIQNTGAHYVAIVRVDQDKNDPSKEYCVVVDDVDNPGVGQFYAMYANNIRFSSENFYVVMPPGVPA